MRKHCVVESESIQPGDHVAVMMRTVNVSVLIQVHSHEMMKIVVLIRVHQYEMKKTVIDSRVLECEMKKIVTLIQAQ